MITLSELIARLESATEGSRELDVLIGYAVDLPLKGFSNRSVRDLCDTTGLEWMVNAADSHTNVLRTALPRFTASIDAALTLAPEGWGSCEMRCHPWWCAPTIGSKPALSTLPCDANVHRDGYQHVPIISISRLNASNLHAHQNTGEIWGAHGEAHTMALALCIANLRACEAVKGLITKSSPQELTR